MDASGKPEKETAGLSGELLIGDDFLVARLGLGTMRLTGKGIWGEPTDRSEAIRVVRRAVELGVNFIDTADSYGPDVSEGIIAEALYPYPEGVVVATKGGLERPGPDQWVENGRPEHLKSACEGSLRRLRLDRIDLYQLHRIDPKVPMERQLGALKDSRRHRSTLSPALSMAGIQTASAAGPTRWVQERHAIPAPLRPS